MTARNATRDFCIGSWWWLLPIGQTSNGLKPQTDSNLNGITQPYTSGIQGHQRE